MGDMNFPDPNTTTEHDGWEWDSEKWTKWGSGGVDDITKTKAIASGVMATGEMVVVNADGTVSVVAQTMVPGEEIDEGLGNAYTWSDAKPSGVGAVYDPETNQVIIAARDGANGNFGTAWVGSVSGGVITFGSTGKVFSAGQVDQSTCIYDSINKKVVIAYECKVNSRQGMAVVGTVTAGDISFGTPTLFSKAATLTTYISGAFDPASGTVVISSVNGSEGGMATAGTVSEDSIAFTARYQFFGAPNFTATSYDAQANRIVIAYKDNSGASTKGYAVVGEVYTNPSGDKALRFGSATELGFDAKEIKSLYDPTSNRHIIVGVSDNNSDFGTVVAGEVSGDSIAFSAPLVFVSDKLYYPALCYDLVADKTIVTFSNGDNGFRGDVLALTVSGSNVSASSIESYNSKAYYQACAFADEDGRAVIAYQNSNDNRGDAICYSTGGTLPDTVGDTNLTPDNFIGVSKGNYADGSEATVQVLGINSDQQGMTIGKQYIQPDGSLEITEGDPSVLAGTAISATELNIKDLV